MRQRITKYRGLGLAILVITLIVMGVAYAQDSGKGATSYAPADIKEDFASIMARMKAAKSEIMKRQIDLGVVHLTRAEAEKDDEHFDGKTTE